MLTSFKKQKNTAVGLDIGKDSVKLVVLKQEGQTIKLSRIDSAKIPAASEADLEQSQVIKKVTNSLLAKNQIKSKEVILGIKGQSVFVKFLEILPVSGEKLEQTIKYEAQQQIPFSMDEVEWDAYLFETAQEMISSSYHTLLVAIKKDRLASKMSLVEEMGLRPPILDISPLTIYNCIRFNQDYDANKLTLVLDIGAQSTDLLLVKGDNFWMRSFAVGGDNLTETLEKRFNISFAEAERLKQKMDIDSPDIKGTINSVLGDLKGEITRSIEYYYFQQKQAPLQRVVRNQDSGQEASPSEGVSSPGAKRIDEILLSGGTSLTRGLDKFLAESFSCEVRRVEPFKKLYLDEEIKKELDSQDKILFIQAMGLALRGLAKSYININLLKEQIKAKALAHQRLMFGVGSVIMAVLILFGASTFMRQDYREKNSRLQKLKHLLNTFATYQPQMKESQRKEKLFSRQITALHNLAVNRALWLEVLSELQKMLPDDLWITELAGTIYFNVPLEEDFQNKLDLQGKAVSYEGVNDFVSRLKSSALFIEVKPLSSVFIEEQAKDKEKVELVKFSISMKVKPMHALRADTGMGSR